MKNIQCIVALAASLLLVCALATPAALGQDRPTAPIVPFVPDAAMERADVPDLFKWDLTKLFADDGAWQKAIDRLEAAQGALGQFEGRLADGAALRDCLKLYFDLHSLANRITLYANLNLNTDVVSARNQSRNDRALKVMASLMEKARFIRNEVMDLDDALLAAAYESAPSLAPYKSYIDGFRRRRGLVLSEEGERILALAGDNLFAEIDLNEIPAAPEKAFGGLMADIVFPEIDDEDSKKVQLSLSNYGRYRGSSDRAVRRGAVSAFFATLKQNQHALAATLGGQVEFSSFLARARGFDSARHAYMDKDNIDVAVYDNLVDTINENLAPLHKYMALRKKTMGVDELRLFDLYVPMVAGVEKEIPFNEARSLIVAALKPLGTDYLELLENGLDPASGWLDLYPCKNKESGAFSASTYGVAPFVKMNYFNSLGDASTLAHEYGHALHSYLSMKNQPPASFRYVSFIAEVASTFNETLLSDYLIANAASREEKLYLLNERAESIRTTIYRQTLFAEFEKEIHALHESGTSLTAAVLNETYRSLVERYYGPAYTIGPDDDIEWAYIPHFYWKFYVYNYATGLSTGISLAKGVSTGGPEALERYLELLGAGSSLPPVALLARAGADLTKPDVIRDAARLLDETLDEMESLMR